MGMAISSQGDVKARPEGQRLGPGGLCAVWAQTTEPGVWALS